ncbi:ribonuclease H-like domain-containing protein [Aspergillus taichungensis]|uniref:Ribonuclease H-like domain-containing protein n=1 Tax=Aspergillus taichungensis TaxID=482145 RepID=A0A2J5HIJ1_9EURO|nr:ribonuclease H-like domain-containing protein [Aspergillus taichungensis]
MSSNSVVPIKFVDSLSTLQELLDTLKSIPDSSPPLSIDLEGIKLGRNGSISILSLYAVHKGIIYLVDVHTLGEAAFSSPRPGQDTSLRAILESPSVKKVIFDVRNDSDALYSHYRISLAGVQDLQLMELATRTYSKKYVAGLAKCIERNSPMPGVAKAEWKKRKDEVSRLFDPRQGGSYDVFNERPMASEVRDYCAADVAHLPVQHATNDRIRLSHEPGYDGQASNKALGPWVEDVTKQWYPVHSKWEDNDLFEDDLHDYYIAAHVE